MTYQRYLRNVFGVIVLATTLVQRSSILHYHDRFHRVLRGYVAVQQAVLLPPTFESNFVESVTPVKSSDTPVYWHVLKSGGTTMKHVLSQCMKLVVADEQARGAEGSLQVIWEEGNQYVNIDTSTKEGIERAKSLHLAQSGVVDVIITPHIHDIADIFDPGHQGRVFALFRHPIDRAVSLFYYLQEATWEPSYDPSLKDMTIEMYASSGKVEENWMTRFLVNKKSEPIGPNDIAVAREILRRKFIVGLLSRPQESMNRFTKFLGWKAETLEKKQCINDLMDTGVNTHEHEPIERGGEVWNRLLAYNRYDLELYMYAVQLFDEQASSISLGLQNVFDF